MKLPAFKSLFPAAKAKISFARCKGISTGWKTSHFHPTLTPYFPTQTRHINSNISLKLYVSSGVEIQLLLIFCLLLALSTRSSQSTCCPKHNGMFPPETLEIKKKSLLTPASVDPR
jgi:hypothetical protein